MRENSFSDGEWKLMNLLWDKSPRTIGEMVKALEHDTGWGKAVITIMMDRLAAAEAVRIDREVRPKQYYPLISREKAVEVEAEKTMERLHADGIGMLLSAMTDSKSLSDDDVRELIALLRSKRKS